jgi:hypothetical protein
VVRISLALILASGSALGLRGAVKAQFPDQLQATFLPLTSIDNLVVVLGFLLGLSYFVFTTAFTRSLNNTIVPRLGRGVLMVSFGASFG